MHRLEAMDIDAFQMCRRLHASFGAAPGNRLRVQVWAVASIDPAECQFVDNLQWLVARQVCQYPLMTAMDGRRADREAVSE